MPNETYTTGKLALDMPNTGSYVNEWAAPLAANWQVLDAAVSGTTSITLSNSDVALTVPIYPASSNPAASPNNPVQNLRILLTGTLTANVSVVLPARVPGMWLIDNQTGGAPYVVTVKTATTGSSGVQPPRSYISFIWTDGTNVAYADGGGAVANALVTPGVPTGTILPFGGYTIPSGYLVCDGSVYAQASYPGLYAVISTYWNAGNEGSGNFRVPNLRNMFLRGWDPAIGGVGLYEADSFKSHTHTANVNDPEHVHGLNTQQGFSGGAGQFAQSSIFQGVRDTLPAKTGITVTNSDTGGTETRPVNRRVEYMIKT